MTSQTATVKENMEHGTFPQEPPSGRVAAGVEAARLQLLVKEKELTRSRDELPHHAAHAVGSGGEAVSI